MELIYKIYYASAVVEEDIPALPKTIKVRIKHAIETKLAQNPEIFGKPLRRSLAGYRKLRVGDYRIVFRIEQTKIKIFGIIHRSLVYKKIETRI